MNGYVVWDEGLGMPDGSAECEVVEGKYACCVHQAEAGVTDK